MSASPAAPEPSALPKFGEEIVVTGSRIPRKDLTTPAPVTVVSRPGALTALLADPAATPDPAAGWELPLVRGEAVGRFEIVREIGRGGFGGVYAALRKRTDPDLPYLAEAKALRARLASQRVAP